MKFSPLFPLATLGVALALGAAHADVTGVFSSGGFVSTTFQGLFGQSSIGRSSDGAQQRGLIMVAGPVGTAQSGSNLVVNTTGDRNDGVCSTTDCSLREAINAANADGANSAITFDATVFAAPRKAIALDGTRLPNLQNNGTLSITAPPAGVVVTGGGSTAFYVNSGANVVLEGLTISGSGNTLNGGGGIINLGTLLVESATLSDNTASQGGAIFNAASLTIRNSTLSGNTTTVSGGALENGSGGSILIDSCTISGNTAPAGRGSGVLSFGAGSTRTEVRNSIIAGNTNSDVDFRGGSNSNSFISTGYNLIGTGNATGAFNRTNDVTGNTNPGLSALAENGGTTMTRATSSASPARNTGDTTLTIDQRGVSRPLGGVDDKGAFEAASDPTGASGLIVTTTEDVVDNDAFISLREAINAANADGANSAITFSETVFAAPRETITLNGTQLPNLLNNGTLSISAPTAGVEISGNNASRVFQVSSGASVTLLGLTIRGGNQESGNGGGVLVDDGALLLDSCTLTSNRANQGGAIYSEINLFSGRTLTIRNCTLSGNTAGSRGGAVFSRGGQTFIESSTVAGNTAPTRQGGGVASFGNLVTPTTISNSIIAGNTGSDVDFVLGNENSFRSGGFNLIGNGNATSTFNSNGDVTDNTNPGLAALADNGGATQTRALLASSPAIDSGNTAIGPNRLGVDQRGFARPRDGDNDGNATDDKGAFEAAFDPTGASALIVTTTQDVEDDKDGLISLREAINTANDAPSDDAISFSETVFAAPRKTITLNGTQLPTIVQLSTLTITAPSAGVEISGNNASRVLQVRFAAKVTLSGLTIRNGNADDGDGGGIDNEGTLLLDSCTLANNRAGQGGAIFSITDQNGRTLTVRNSTLSGNTATTRGGGVYNFRGLAVIESSTIAGNTAPTNAGGGVASNGFDTTLTRVSNSIVAGNTGSDVNFVLGSDNSFESSGYNLIGTGNATPAFNQDGDIINNTDPGLAQLANNGGKTQTRALISTSPARNTGQTDFTEDQRGLPRQQGGADDKGAFEFAESNLNESLVVTTLADEDDDTSDPAFGTGTSLREAIKRAGSDGVASAITFSETVFGAARQTIPLNGTQLPALASDNVVTITAPSVGVEISGNNASRVFSVNSDADATLSGLTIRNGNAGTGLGGGIVNSGRLLLDSCTLTGNRAAQGGAIVSTTSLNGRTLTIRNCTLSGNTATTRGGGVYNRSGLTAIESSTIAGNTASTNAGGGGVASAGDEEEEVLTRVSNSIVAGNMGSDVDFVLGFNNSFESSGYNLIGTGKATGAFNQDGDVINNTDPGLAALDDNGGPTQTRALLATSPALDAGQTDLTTDQRGFARPRDGDNNGNAADDKGAFEAAFDPTGASALIVTTTQDVEDDKDGLTSLREAINTANDAPSDDAISFSETVFATPRKTITLLTDLPDLVLNGTLSITAPSVGVIVSGDNARRVFVVASGARVTLTGLTIVDGRADLGAGVRNYGTLTLLSCVLSGHRASNSGGGIFNEAGASLTVERGTLRDNDATPNFGKGGGIHNEGNLTVSNSSFGGNDATFAAAIYNAGTSGRGVTLNSVTVADNTGTDSGGIINDSATAVTLTNTLIARNVSSGGTNRSQIAGNFTGSHNLISIGDGGSGLTDGANGNRVGNGASPVDAKLGELADNGGPTPTFALLVGSPARNTGQTDLTEDQRGVSRPQGGADDKGAFEVQVANTAPVVNPTINSPKVPGPTDLVITDPHGSDADGDTLTYSFVYKINGTTIAGETDKPNRVDLSKYTVAVGDTFTATFTANDGKVNSAPVTLTRIIAAAPVANAFSGSAPSGTETALGPITGTDPNGLALRYVLLSQPANGSAFLAGSANNVQLYYTSRPRFGGVDTMTFQVVNSEGRRSAPATISVTVEGNRAPTASNGSATVTAGVRTEVPLVASDPDGDELRYRIVTAPTKGSAFVANNTNGGVSLFYTANKNASGADSVQFTVTDTSGATSAAATISITVAGNSAPVANATSLDAASGVRASVLLSGSDADGDELVRYRITTQPAHGSAFLAGSGDNVRLYYTSNAGYSGADSVKFTVTDSTGRTSAPATVSVAVSGGASGSASGSAS